MPALRSLFTSAVFAACLAQAWAGPQPQYGSGGGSGGYGSGGSGGSSDSHGDQRNQDQTVTMTETMMMTVTSVQANADVGTVTVTVTAVPACNSVVTATAYINQCGAGLASSDMTMSMPMATGSQPVPDGAAFIMTTMMGAITPGLSSIPVAQAVQTGVTVAAAPPAAPPVSGLAATTAAVSMPMPNGQASILTTASGAILPGLSSIPASDAVMTGVTIAASPPAAPSPASFFTEGSTTSSSESASVTDSTSASSAASDTTITLSSTSTTTETAPAAVQTYSNSGLLGIGRRFVALPTAVS